MASCHNWVRVTVSAGVEDYSGSRMAAVCRSHPLEPAGARRFNAQAAYLCSSSAMPPHTVFETPSGESRQTRLHIIEASDETNNSLDGIELPYDVLYLLPSSTDAGAAQEIRELIKELMGSEGVRLNKRWAPVDHSMGDLWRVLSSKRSDTSPPASQDEEPTATDLEVVHDLLALSESSPPTSPPKKRAKKTQPHRRATKTPRSDVFKLAMGSNALLARKKGGNRRM